MLFTPRVLCCLMALLGLIPHPALGMGSAEHIDAAALAGDQIELLKQQIVAQQEQIDQLRRQVEEQRRMLEAVSRRIAPKADPETASIPQQDGPAVQVAGLFPAAPVKSGDVPIGSAIQAAVLPSQSAEQPQPLSFGIGSAQITPVGWIDLTAYMRKGNVGSGLGTNFASVPFENSINGNLHEVRQTSQGTRMGFRLDAPVRGARLLGYLETDFNGISPGNASVTSNSNSLRVRLAWVEVAHGRVRILGGQSWSLLTPNRRWLSPLPADVFSSMVIDPNHHVGLPWGRVPQFRLTYRPNDNVSVGLSAEAAEQYIGGSAGAGISILPSQLVSSYAGQLTTGVTSFSTPTPMPDIIAKVAVDRTAAGHPLHFEVAGLVRRFRVYNPLARTSYGAMGAGGSVNLSFEPMRNFRLLFNSLYGNGGGRYMFGLGPDFIVRGDGSLSLIRAYSTMDGFEFQAGRKTSLYGYYGGTYFQKNTAIDPATDEFVGYGFNGSPSSHNRTIQQITFGMSHTLWRDPQFGGLQFNTQYSHVLRHPWDMPANQPRSAHMDMLYMNLRYLLPGAPPAK